MFLLLIGLVLGVCVGFVLAAILLAGARVDDQVAFDTEVRRLKAELRGRRHFEAVDAARERVARGS